VIAALAAAIAAITIPGARNDDGTLAQYVRRMPQTTRGRARVLVLVVIASLVGLATGCEKVTPENLDKWMNTEKGPDKLAKAMVDGSLDPDLSAHAAANLIKIGKDGDVKTAIANMPDDRRKAVLGNLAGRLWDMARIDGDYTVPSPQQSNAKDLLFDLRKPADPDTRAKIDGYLTDWYTNGDYEDRAKMGRYQGATVIRALGPEAGAKLKSTASAVINGEKNGQKYKIGDNLLLGLAVSGNPDSAALVLAISRMQRGDDTLVKRCVSALYMAYVDPGDLGFDVQDGKALEKSLPALEELAKDESLDHTTGNDAVALIRAVGAPACMEPLIGMIRSLERQRRWTGAYNALLCGGPPAIGQVAEAMPTDTGYDAAEMTGSVSGEIAKLQPKEQALAESRKLLGSSSWVARWIGIEALAAMKSKDDLPAIQKLQTDKAPLTGYWGDQSDVDAKDRKKDPTLGERAGELAKALQ
jgi:hypothetical protein